jgi:deoxyribodipyrimidine photo-lyase
VHTAVVLFTRDLRVRDNPALDAACSAAEAVVPLFVLDDGVLGRFGAPNRVAFLLDALADLDGALRERGGALVVRRGDVVAETVRCAREAGATVVFVADDVSAYAGRRERRLLDAGLDVRAAPGVTVVAPGTLAPAGGDHFAVFTAYWNRWRTALRRAAAATPGRVSLPAGVDPGRLPTREELGAVGLSPGLARGGEREAARRLRAWLEDGLPGYAARRDDLASDGTSRLSAYLHFGCLSPREVAERAAALPGGEDFVRQLCWRDFNHQLLAARPRAAIDDLRPRGDRWRQDDEALGAWIEGRTGYPLVDAGMRQLRAEGFMHNRARLVTASFLVKHLYLDWRVGARHFESLLVDGDLANNRLNWQWVAGTGADTRPNRVFNPTRQAHRYDPTGEYVRWWVPELEAVGGAAVHEPWKLGLLAAGYPHPIVEHEDAVRRFRVARGLDVRRDARRPPRREA